MMAPAATQRWTKPRTVAAAIAQWFARQSSRVAVLKPIDSGCVRRREGLISPDAEVLEPVDRDVFRRQNRYYEALQPNGAAPASKPEK